MLGQTRDSSFIHTGLTPNLIYDIPNVHLEGSICLHLRAPYGILFYWWTPFIFCCNTNLMCVKHSDVPNLESNQGHLRER